MTVDLAQSIGNFAKEVLGNLSSENLPELRVQVEGTPKDLNPVVRDEVTPFGSDIGWRIRGQTGLALYRKSNPC